MSRRKIRMFVLAGYVAAGAFVTQFLTLCASTGTAGLSSSGLLIDNNGYFLGLLYVCGTENYAIRAADGVLGPVINQDDDLMWGCPVREIPVGGGG
ncbi:MAG: hypothetical protein KF841_03935 [Phycisphaerae bacterium]|nr:hypothetical protein [Phycisphaerae bacterium]